MIMSMLSINKILLMCIIVLGLAACTGLPTTSSNNVPTVPTIISNDYKAAATAFKAKKYNRAIALFTAIVKQYPQSTLSHTNLGLLYLQQNKLKLAYKHFSESLKLTPANPVAHNHIGLIYRQQGEFDEALLSYKLAIKFKANYANAHLNLAILYDIYLHDIVMALQHYHHYQGLNKKPDKLVTKWIIDNERRLPAEQNGENQ